jgi:hypothetical protein
VLALTAAAGPLPEAKASDSLHSWNSGPVKSAIVKFVRDVTTEGGPSYIPPAERIAVFSHDGTLSPAMPVPAQLAFALDRVKAVAPRHPRWTAKEPFKSALTRNLKSLAALGPRGTIELVNATHAGMTDQEFDRTVLQWLAKGRIAKLNRLYAQSAYQPMLELLAYLRTNGFTTYIVSCSGIEFMRPWSEKAYGIPPERVIGSSTKMKFEIRKGAAVLVRRAEYDLIDEKGGKPAGIYRWLGRKPIAAFGCSDDDIETLEWVSSGAGPHLAVLVRHTDGENEFAYDRSSVIGRLDRALGAAKKKGWFIADMTKDWNRIFPKTIK